MRLLPRSVALSVTHPAVGADVERSAFLVDADYWLSHCEGFEVDGPDGRLGVVERVVFRSREDRPDLVAVSSGVWRLHTDWISVADVVEVLPAQERLRVQSAADARAGRRS